MDSDLVNLRAKVQIIFDICKKKHKSTFFFFVRTKRPKCFKKSSLPKKCHLPIMADFNLFGQPQMCSR